MNLNKQNRKTYTPIKSRAIKSRVIRIKVTHTLILQEMLTIHRLGTDFDDFLFLTQGFAGT